MTSKPLDYSKLRILTPVILHTPNGKRKFVALIDSGSDENLINVMVAKENGLQYTPTTTPTVKAINDTLVHVYGEVAPMIEYEGMAKPASDQHQFLAVDLLEYDFILGLPWLRAVDPIIE